jgi:hypothetical protein
VEFQKYLSVGGELCRLRNDFDWEISHVIPAIIRNGIEVRERGDDSISAWSTIELTREFLYVEDSVREF